MPTDGIRRSANQWQDLYVAAVLEADNSRLQARIEAAQKAIEARAREMDDKASVEERTALSDARFLLKVLHKERLQQS